MFKIKVIFTVSSSFIGGFTVRVLQLSLVGFAVQHLFFKTRHVYHLHEVNGVSGGDVSGRGNEGVADV